MSLLAPKNAEQEESHWLSVSDLMAGLMMVFLFVAVALMLKVSTDKAKIESVAVAYQENQVAIFEALMEEFSKDLERWDARIDQDSLTFIFQSPEILFARGRADLTPQYRDLLQGFFPRYMAVLWGFKDSIDEVRIEGHTSSIWNGYVSDTEAYFKNMELSQNRTRSVLSYIYQLPDVSEHTAWIKRHIAAVGLSSSRVLFDENGSEDGAASRRVTFRVITNADIQMRKILELQQ